MKRIALVTGTSSGIGLSTAVLLARADFTVVATMRDLARAEALTSRARTEGVTLDVRRLDVQDDQSVESCVQGILRDHGRIDVLVNNAGSGLRAGLEQTSTDDLRRVMDVNFFGVWRVTQAVLPAMRSSKAGRIITVSSVGGVIGQPFNDAYCAAKFAVEGMMECLAPVAKRLGLHVSLIEPGPVNTEFVATVKKQMAGSSAPMIDEYGAMLEAYTHSSVQAFASLGQTGDDIGSIIVQAATEEAPHLRYPTSDLMGDIIGRKLVDPTGDSVVALSGTRLG